MIRCSRSIADTATSTAQKNAATAAPGQTEREDTAGDQERGDELDGRIDERDPNPAVPATATQHRVGQERHVVVPRDLLLAGSCRPKAAETIERRNGTRAATTFRKLPSASAGAKTTAARAKSTLGLSAQASP